MGETPGEVVSAAVVRTMRGGAQLRLSVHTRVPEFEARSEFSGIVDFASDRSRLDGESDGRGEAQPESIILDGPTTYTHDDGRWVVASGADGTRGMFHVSGLLEALAHARTSAAELAEHRFELALDHDALDRVADAGLASDWESTAITEIAPSGRIANLVLTHRSRQDPLSFMRVTCEISEPFEIGEIELPTNEMTISLSAKSEQRSGNADA